MQIYRRIALLTGSITGRVGGGEGEGLDPGSEGGTHHHGGPGSS